MALSAVALDSSRPCASAVIFEENWETGPGGWDTPGGTWQVGTPTYAVGPNSCYEGGQCAGTVLDGPYSRYADARLISPPIRLERSSSEQSIVLSYYQWFKLGYVALPGQEDFGRVEVRVAGGPWEVVSDTLTLDSPQWTRRAIDLTSYAGSTIQIAFHLTSLGGLGAGWYVDAIRIESAIVTLLPLETFESGVGHWYADRGTWQVGTPTYAVGPNSCYEGGQCAGTVLDGPYSRYADARLISPPIRLERSSSEQSIVLSYYQWFKLGYVALPGQEDFGRVEVRVAGGPCEVVSDTLTLDSPQWTRRAIDLTSYAGSTIQIAFHLTSLGGLAAGWYVDAIRLSGIGPVFQSRITYPTTTAGDAHLARAEVPNYRETPLPVGEVRFTDDSFGLPPGFADTLARGLEVQPGSTATIPIAFLPRSGGQRRGRAAILRGGAADTISVVELEGTGRPVDFEWTSRDFYPTREIAEGEEVQIAIEMADSVEVDSALVWFAEAGSRSFRSRRLTLSHDDPVNDRYVGSTPEEVATARGLELFLAAYNGSVVVRYPAAAPEAFRVRIGNLALPTEFPPRVYKMFTIPLEIPNNTATAVLEDDLGAPDPSRWRMFGQSARGSNSCAYVEHTTGSSLRFRVGDGYWLVTRDGARLDTAPLQGTTVTTAAAHSESLQCEWNMIGNPFAFRVHWDSLRVDDRSVTSQTAVEPPQWWNGSSYIEKRVLEPFEAYWIRRRGDSTRVLEFPPVECLACSASVTVAAEDRLRASCELAIRIDVDCAGTSDANNFVGWCAGAAVEGDGIDRSDAPLPPARAVSLYFPHSRWPEDGERYTHDLRPLPPAGARALSVSGEPRGEVWAFDVAKSFSDNAAGDEVLFHFMPLAELPPGMRVHLIDQTLGRHQDLRESGMYRFRSPARGYVAEEECRFLLTIGDDEHWDGVRDRIPAPAATRLLGIVANPARGSAVIRYEVARPTRVELRIFDLRGAPVRSFSDEAVAPGGYEMEWEGKDAAGRRLPAGIYFLRLIADGVARTKKITLLR